MVNFAIKMGPSKSQNHALRAENYVTLHCALSVRTRKAMHKCPSAPNAISAIFLLQSDCTGLPGDIGSMYDRGVRKVLIKILSFCSGIRKKGICFPET